MHAATARLARAIEQKEHVLLYGDYDVDGTSALVVLKKVLDLAGGIATCFVPHRIRDGYGMKSEAVEDAAALGVKLIVSVDTGIRASQVVKHAAGLGIDVIVTDHHLPEAELPPAVAVLNPNRPDCPYPEKNLCGAGVALKLADALLSTLGWERPRRERLVDSLLKLVAIATVADVVPLVGRESRHRQARIGGIAEGFESRAARVAGRRGDRGRRRAEREAGRVSDRSAHQRRGAHGQRQRHRGSVHHR